MHQHAKFRVDRLNRCVDMVTGVVRSSRKLRYIRIRPLRLGVTHVAQPHRVHLWLDGKRIVDFLLVLIELFSPALAVEAIRADIG